jgi:hypothetical protein
MTETEWLTCDNALRILEFVRDKTTNSRKLRLLGCSCVRQVWTYSGDGPLSAVDAAERFADGSGSKAALRRARQHVRAARYALIDAGEAAGERVWPIYWLAEVAAAENAYGSVLSEMDRLATDARFMEVNEWSAICNLIRDMFGNPFRPVVADARWRTSIVVGLAEGIYEDRAFDRLPILADALEDAGCDNTDVLAHCRGDGPHVRGCWVVDLILGKE